MKHCKTCENCEIDPLCLYLKDIEYRRCVIDGHHIEEPFGEKCEHYRKADNKEVTLSSWLFRLVEYVKKNAKIN